MSSVQERVKKLICEQLGVKDDEVKDEASFVEDLGDETHFGEEADPFAIAGGDAG